MGGYKNVLEQQHEILKITTFAKTKTNLFNHHETFVNLSWSKYLSSTVTMLYQIVPTFRFSFTQQGDQFSLVDIDASKLTVGNVWEITVNFYCRIAIEIERCEFPSLPDSTHLRNRVKQNQTANHYSTYLNQFIDIRWEIVSFHYDHNRVQRNLFAN